MPFFRKRWHRRVSGYLIIYFVVLMGLVAWSDRLILFPSRDPIELAGQRRVEIATAHGKLEIWTERSFAGTNRAPEAYVLAFIGNASRAEYEAEYTAYQWDKLPVEIWGVNYPGFGGSEGSAKLKLIAPAALAAYDALSKRAAGRPIFISGNSIGTTAALYVAAHRPVAGLVLKNPPPLRQLVLGNYGWWNLWLAAGPFVLHIPDELDSLANARQVKAPAIFLLAGQDTVVPPKYHQKVVNAFAGPRQIIRMPQAGHNSPVEDEALVQLRAELKTWLAD